MQPTPLAWRWSPIEVLARWPRSTPLAALVSGRGDDAARWSIFGLPSKWCEIPNGLPRELAIAALRAISDRACEGNGGCSASAVVDGRAASDAPPFRGGWIGSIAYEFGAIVEPASLRLGRVDEEFPLVGGWHCDAAAVHDAKHDRWWWCTTDATSRLTAHAGSSTPPTPPTLDDGCAERAALGSIRAELAPGEFESMVRRTIELIHAGDLYQANISQRFDAALAGSARALAIAALDASLARHGAVIELPDDRTIISMSPELFLQRRGDRVITRPIKGTRPRGSDRCELLHDSKERAELAMIVDLMRNDLARVCAPGTVRVMDARRIEGHCGVEHAVAEVEGRLARSQRNSDLILATFPPGSVTGAPKIRAMQVIEALEESPRGPYCGAVGLIGDDGDLVLNVAIRTLCVHAGLVRCSTGCGIVADSDPDAESRESLVKLEPFRRAAEQLTPPEAASASAATRSPSGSAPPRSVAPVRGS